MKTIGHLIGLAAVAAVLAAAAQFTERRSVPNWAPGAVVAAKAKPAETAAAAPDGKAQVAALPAPSSELAVASRPSAIDAEATGGLPREPERVGQAPAPELSPAAAREPRKARPVRQARAPEAPAAPRAAAPARDPIQFRLAEGNR